LGLRWLPWRGAVQHPQYPGGVTAKLFIFFTIPVKIIYFFTMSFFIHSNRIHMHKKKTNTTQKY
jgi:hypothetical protein